MPAPNRTPLTLALALMVIIPFGLLAWLGTRVVQQESTTVQTQFDTLLQARLTDIDQTVVRLLQTRQRELDSLLQRQSPSPAPRRSKGKSKPSVPVVSPAAATLRNLAQRTPTVANFFLLGRDGVLRVPPLDEQLSRDEQMFLLRTKHIWLDQTVLRQARNTEAPTRAQSPQAQYGWTTWFWEAGLHLLYWRRLPDGSFVGAEVDRIRFLADLVAELPASVPGDAIQAGGRIALVNARREVVYQWGGWSPSDRAKARVTLPLSAPLSAWTLHYYVSPEALPQSNTSALTAVLLPGLVAVALALGGLALYLYREHTRALREAVERVSFVNQVSHELKTPLTNIRMYAELMQNTVEEEDERSHQHLGVVVSESQRLSRLISNVLTFARHQRGRLALRPSPGQPDEIIGEVLTQFKPGLAEKGVRPTAQANANRTVRLDADVFAQILANLVSNVEKYAAGGGALTVRSSFPTATQLQVEVEDAGPGIPREEWERIFLPFERRTDAINEGAAGTGIGLTIARELARLHGGDLCIVPSDTGTCFRLTLEVKPV